MTWHFLTATGATRDLWVVPTNDDAPEYGVWHLRDGIDVKRMLGVHGPDALTEPIWWEQMRETRGTRLRDMLWQGGGGFKLISRRLLEVMTDGGAELEVFEVDVRLRRGEAVPGYVGVLEPDDVPGPVHSYERGRRTSGFVVSDEVRTAIEAAGLTGLVLEAADSADPFPGELESRRFDEEQRASYAARGEPVPDLPIRPLRIPPEDVRRDDLPHDG